MGWWIEHDPDTVLAPPVAYLTHGKIQGLGPDFPKGAPDLAVDFTSPGDDYWLGMKRRALFACGLQQFWVLNADKSTVHVYTSPTQVRILTKAGTLDGGDVMPGFSCLVREIFSVL